MSSFTFYRGDALTVLKTLPDESVNAVVTDPPCNSGGRPSSERTGRDARAKYVTSKSAHDLKTFPGENRDQRSYRSWLTELLTEAYQVSTQHSVATVFSDWRQEPTTSDALQMAGWTWQGTIPWIKPASRPRKGGFKQSAEFITWGVKGTIDSSRSLYPPGHFIASQPRKDRVHITQKPLEIMQQLVRICPDDGVVLDAFTGSGSTGVAALREGRRFVGVELSPHYAEIADQRLRAELTQDDFVLAGPEA
ncbi:DNA methyltransferase [Kitasatospora sp. NBC_00240]|uniref:DNA-methyltransferase n=1 Tax=Kitasatospora sp. NBC_00240 TaxID=2903567 RepID=UPI0022508BA8|nr:DNA methyltransferase [Kitasatospora sp. NBC_00240]MCX5208344.1 DNA methyltransferase [Kitasatospora sp. NBC_00240]